MVLHLQASWCRDVSMPWITFWENTDLSDFCGCKQQNSAPANWRKQNLLKNGCVVSGKKEKLINKAQRCSSHLDLQKLWGIFLRHCNLDIGSTPGSLPPSADCFLIHHHIVTGHFPGTRQCARHWWWWTREPWFVVPILNHIIFLYTYLFIEQTFMKHLLYTKCYEIKVYKIVFIFRNM